MMQSQNAGAAILTPRQLTEREMAGRPAAPRSLAGSETRIRRISPARFLAWFGVVFVIAFGLVWIYAATMPMAFLSRDYPLWVAKRTLMDECQLGTVAVFGDSRTLAATIPGAMPVATTNLALSGSSPIETYFAVRRMLRCPAVPKLVVIAHGALKFVSDSDYWAAFARNGVLSYADMRQVDRDAAELHDSGIQRLLPGDQMPLVLRELLYSIRFPAFYFDSIVNSFVAARWHHNQAALRDNLASSGHALFGTASGSSDVASEGQNPDFRTSPLIDLYFSRTVAMLADRGIPVVFVSIPVNHATFVRMPADLSAQFATYMRSKADEFRGLYVVGPAIPCWPDQAFGDAWHFNMEGATAFSRMLGARLSEVLVSHTPKDLPNRCTQPDLTTEMARPTVAER